jgi:hypothetical protein
MINYLSQYKSQNETGNWEIVKQYYKHVLNIDPIVLDYIATYDILHLCCQGRSIDYIANALELDTDYIVSTLMEFFQFSGLVVDLDVNFRDIYKRSRYNKYACVSMAKTLDKVSDEKVYNLMYNLNQALDKIEERIEEYYERS